LESSAAGNILLAKCRRVGPELSEFFSFFAGSGIPHRRSGSMSKFNPLLKPRPPVIWGYGIAALSVVAALIISRWPAINLQTAPVSLLLCAVMFSAWLGGVGPGLLAIALSSLAFDYYFIKPLHLFALKSVEIPRLVIFVVAALFVGSLSAAQRNAVESRRRARDDLKGTVQDLQKVSEALQEP
jgi:K+-sensing histidine kinase KdpD